MVQQQGGGELALLALPADALAHVALMLDTRSALALARACRTGRALLPRPASTPWCCGACSAARTAANADAPCQAQGEAWCLLYPAKREATALSIADALAARGAALRPAAFARVCADAEHEDLACAVASSSLVISIDRGRASLRSVCRGLGIHTPIVGLISDKLQHLESADALVDRVLLPTLSTMGALPLIYESPPKGYEWCFQSESGRTAAGHRGGRGGVLFSGECDRARYGSELHSYR